MSDCGAIGFVQETHHFTATPSSTTATAFLGGCDLECGGPPGELAQYLPKVVGKSVLAPTAVGGRLSVRHRDIDMAVGRVLKILVRLGELDSADTATGKAKAFKRFFAESVDTAEHRKLAMLAAQESIVLLKNQKNLLPIKTGSKVAFVGPHANSTQALLGDYHTTSTVVNSNSPLMAAMRAELVTSHAYYAPGCDIDVADPTANGTSITAAAALAAKADIAVLFLGICGSRDPPGPTSVLPHEPASECGTFWESEESDRHTILLPPVQRKLFAAVHAKQPKVVVVLANGGSLSLGEIGNMSAAVVEMFYLGEMAGPAIVSVLSGAYNPGGKLPYTQYTPSIMRRPFTSMGLRENGGITYQWYSGAVEFEFGHGLSFTSFIFHWPAVGEASCGSGPATLAITDVATSPPIFCVVVRNVGGVAGDAVTLAFVSSTESAVNPDWPVKRLFGFHRSREIAAGASVTVPIQSSSDFISTVDSRGVRWLQPGSYGVAIGDIVKPAWHTLSLKGEPLVLESYPTT